VIEKRLGLGVADAVPGDQHPAPPGPDARAGQESQQHTGADGGRQQGSGGEGFLDLEVGYLAGHLDRPDGPGHCAEMSDEPAAGHEDARNLEGQAQQVEPGDEARRRRRDGLGPPDIGQHTGRPPADEQDGDQNHRKRGQPPALLGHTSAGMG